MSLVDIEIFNKLKAVGDHSGTLDNIAEVALLLAQMSLRENGLKRYYDEL